MPSKLSRYTSFDDLKSAGNSNRASHALSKKLMSEYAAFLNSLRNQFKFQTKSKAQDGRKIK
jgi:hypothetical protein